MITESVNRCLSRTILTSTTVFLVSLMMYAFGGEGIHLFAFVMVIGVLTSMYSSIFIAAPLLLFLPYYLKKLASRPGMTAVMVVATIAGTIVTLKTTGTGTTLWVGAALAFNIPIHFLWFFFPWLTHKDPDSFVRDELEAEKDDRPIE